jgi:hypothetical protein
MLPRVDTESFYRCEALTLEGFVQQLAVSYLANEYWFYVTGRVPERKDPRAVDEKLIAKYEIAISKWARTRRKGEGIANIHYIRFGRFYVLLATHGRHSFFTEEASVIRDARHVPIKFGGYSLSFRGGHAHVRIEQGEYKRLKREFLAAAVHRPAEAIERDFRSLRFEPYAPVRRQLFNLLRAVNRARKVAGLELVPNTCLRLNRAIYRPFGAGSGSSL